jgi:hypothetical protein
VWRNAMSDQLKLLYATPEKFAKSPSFLNLLKSLHSKGMAFFLCRELRNTTNLMRLPAG